MLLYAASLLVVCEWWSVDREMGDKLDYVLASSCL